jgi:aminoglycoside phosphotransferase (APT) family kinase protein
MAPVREARALQLLAPLDVAPRYVFYDPDLAPVVIYEFMAGEMWDRHRPTSAELNELATVWSTVNGVSGEELWLSRAAEPPATIATRIRRALDRYARWVAEIDPALGISDDVINALLERLARLVLRLESISARRCFCRSDPRFANVIRRPDGRLGLVDWEDSGLLDPARDVADLMTHPNQEDLVSPDGWAAFLDPYLNEHGGNDASVRDRLHLYLGLFPIFWLAILLEVGLQRAATERLAGWRINEVPANERLRRYLARALAWPNREIEPHVQELQTIRFFPSTNA